MCAGESSKALSAVQGTGQRGKMEMPLLSPRWAPRPPSLSLWIVGLYIWAMLIPLSPSPLPSAVSTIASLACPSPCPCACSQEAWGSLGGFPHTHGETSMSPVSRHSDNEQTGLQMPVTDSTVLSNPQEPRKAAGHTGRRHAQVPQPCWPQPRQAVSPNGKLLFCSLPTSTQALPETHVGLSDSTSGFLKVCT